MSGLIDSLTALETLDREQGALARRKRELERRSWTASGRIISRARQLVTDATLSLLSQGSPVDAASLRQEISRLVGKGDRFAENLCDDWLDATTETHSIRAGEDAPGVGD